MPGKSSTNQGRSLVENAILNRVYTSLVAILGSRFLRYEQFGQELALCPFWDGGHINQSHYLTVREKEDRVWPILVTVPTC